MKKAFERLFLIFFVLTWSVGCDQATKRVAERTLKGAPIHSMLKDTIRLQYIQNSGAFLGFGSNFSETIKFWLFLVIPIATLFFLIIFSLFSSELSKGQLISLMLFAGGGIGNLIDRILWDGKVTDFLNIGVGSLRTGIFNIADVSVLFGTFGFFAIAMKDSYLQKRAARREALAEKAALDAIIFDEPTFLNLSPAPQMPEEFLPENHFMETEEPYWQEGLSPQASDWQEGLSPQASDWQEGLWQEEVQDEDFLEEDKGEV